MLTPIPISKLAPEYGSGGGLAYAMAIVAAIYLWAGTHYLLAGRYIGADLASVRDGTATGTA